MGDQECGIRPGCEIGIKYVAEMEWNGIGGWKAFLEWVGLGWIGFLECVSRVRCRIGLLECNGWWECVTKMELVLVEMRS